MSLQLGSKAPDFKTVTTEGPVHFYEWKKGKWALFFSHPADFTPVCTTELGMVAKMMPEFEARNCKAIGISVDGLESHQRWISDIESTQNVKMNYPLIADDDAEVADLYEMIHPLSDEKLTVRSVFFIDPNNKVRATLTYPPATGRNFDEILRVLDGLQLTDSHKVATPVNWKPGDDVVIVPSITDVKELRERFPKGFQVVTPYLRITPQPD